MVFTGLFSLGFFVLLLLLSLSLALLISFLVHFKGTGLLVLCLLTAGTITSVVRILGWDLFLGQHASAINASKHLP